MILNEISMRPTDLKARVAKLTRATVGLEFELIVKDVGYKIGEESDGVADYDQDTSVYDSSWPALASDIKTFFVGEYNTRPEIDHILHLARDEYINWQAEQWDEYIAEHFEFWVEQNHSVDVKDLDSNEVDEYLTQFRSEYFEAFEDEEGSVTLWISNNRLTNMIDWMERYDLAWPKYTDPSEGKMVGEGSRDLRDIAYSFREVVGIPVEYSTGVKDLERSQESYILEPDESLEPTNKKKNKTDVGLEFVSPPMSVDEAIEQIHKVKKWCITDKNGYTNDSCGLHINVSFPAFRLWDLDYVKLAVFLGDDYVATQFGRLGNFYANSTVGKIKDKINAGGPELITEIIKHMKRSLYQDASGLIMRMAADKYVTINTKDNRVEFRGAGGNWLKMDLDKIINTILRFVVALDIALDPDKFKKEYAKKLYKLISPRGNDAMALFSLYQSGNMSAAELKLKWAKLVQTKTDVGPGTKNLARKFINKNYWDLINGITKKVVTTFDAPTKEEASKKAVAYVDKHNPKMFWYVDKAKD